MFNFQIRVNQMVICFQNVWSFITVWLATNMLFCRDYCPTVTTKHIMTRIFLWFIYQGEPGIDGEAGVSGPEGAKASSTIRHTVTENLIYSSFEKKKRKEMLCTLWVNNELKQKKQKNIASRLWPSVNSSTSSTDVYYYFLSFISVNSLNTSVYSSSLL